MNTFKEHVKKRTQERQLAINNDDYSISPKYEVPLTKETHEQLEDLKTVALDKGRAIAEDLYNRYFDKDRRAIEMLFTAKTYKDCEELDYLLECLCLDAEIEDLLETLYNIIYKQATVFKVKVTPSLWNAHNLVLNGVTIDIENESCSIEDIVFYDVVCGFHQTARGSDFTSKFFQIPYVRYILNAFLFEVLTTPIIKYWWQCKKDYSLSLTTGKGIGTIRSLKHDSYIDDIKEWLDNYHKGEFSLTKKDGNKVVDGECTELIVELNGSKVKYCIFFNRNKALATLIYENRQLEQLIFSALSEADKKEVIKILYTRLVTDTIVFNFGVYNKHFPLCSVDWKWFLSTVDIPSDVIDLSDGNFMFKIEHNNRSLMQMLQDYQDN